MLKKSAVSVINCGIFNNQKLRKMIRNLTQPIATYSIDSRLFENILFMIVAERSVTLVGCNICGKK